jgi:hypothetical protein
MVLRGAVGGFDSPALPFPAFGYASPMRRTLLSLAVLLGVVFVGGYVARSWLDNRTDRTLLEFLFLVQIFLAWSHLSTENQIEHLRREVQDLRRREPDAS